MSPGKRRLVAAKRGTKEYSSHASRGEGKGVLSALIYAKEDGEAREREEKPRGRYDGVARRGVTVVIAVVVEVEVQGGRRRKVGRNEGRKEGRKEGKKARRKSERRTRPEDHSAQ